MVSRKSRQRQASRRAYENKVRKLQRAGYLKNVNPKKKPTPSVFAAFTRHKDILQNKAAVLKAPSKEKARELRLRLGAKGSGKNVILPRERGEKFTISKSGKIRSHREAYGQTIDKEIGAELRPPEPGEKLYYTLPTRKRGLGRITRHTFSSFDELLAHISAYDIDFEDIEDYIEIERFREGSTRERREHRKYLSERKAAYKRAKARERRRRKARR